jgi:hypothetical protein
MVRIGIVCCAESRKLIYLDVILLLLYTLPIATTNKLEKPAASLNFTQVEKGIVQNLIIVLALKKYWKISFSGCRQMLSFRYDHLY